MRKSDPLRCNKCGYPLTAVGLCDQDCTPVPTLKTSRIRLDKIIGRSHLGHMAAPVPSEEQDEAA